MNLACSVGLVERREKQKMSWAVGYEMCVYGECYVTVAMSHVLFLWENNVRIRVNMFYMTKQVRKLAFYNLLN